MLSPDCCFSVADSLDHSNALTEKNMRILTSRGRQQLIHRRVKRGILPFLCLALVALCFNTPARADEYMQLKVIVNQLDHANLPDVDARQKEMNDILKKCDKFKKFLRVTIAKPREN